MVKQLWGDRGQTLRRWAIALGAGILAGLTMPTIARAAERIELTFGAFGLSLELQSLERFAKTGEISDELSFYTRFIKPDQLAEVRAALTERLDINVLAVSQFFNSPQGEAILRRLAVVIRTGRNLPSVPALRSAIIQSAADPAGLTPLNLLRYYPTPSLRVDLAKALSIWRQIEEVSIHHAQAIENVEQAFRDATSTLPPMPPQWELGLSGPYQIVKTSRQITPPDRRPFGADVYWPIGAKGDRPIAIISHGLGSDRRTYAYLGLHLASRGFVAVLLEHPGSDSRYIQALIDGRASELADPLEFLARPADVKDMLNLLATDPQPPIKFMGSLAINHVGVIGQSFGGYTALATAGAALNFQQLDKDCNSDDVLSNWNTSLLLQCRALVARPSPQVDRLSLVDPRVKAVIAINPITSSLFGQAGIEQLRVPTAIVSGSSDPIALPLPEQLRPFTQLPASDKRLVIMRGATHFSTMGETGDETFQFPPQVVGPRPDLARNYLKAFVTAFLVRYLEGDRSVDRYLTPAWAKSVSQSDLPIWLLDQLNPNQLPTPGRTPIADRLLVPGATPPADPPPQPKR
ncbi:MAG: alpha/beta hydrolase [Oscillatoriales cyanobacterium]|nr:MAG: alpha/beta hydrolase [Oscillatoriales cyanobacterium]